MNVTQDKTKMIGERERELGDERDLGEFVESLFIAVRTHIRDYGEIVVK